MLTYSIYGAALADGFLVVIALLTYVLGVVSGYVRASTGCAYARVDAGNGSIQHDLAAAADIT